MSWINTRRRLRPNPAAAIVLAAVLGMPAAGCRPRATPPPGPPESPPVQSSEIYRVCGKVLDSKTLVALSQVRLSFRAVVPTAAGPRAVRVFGLTGPDGAYALETSLSRDLMGQARSIRISAGKPGYVARTVDVPAPVGSAGAHQAPVILLSKEASNPSGAGVVPSPPRP